MLSIMMFKWVPLIAHLIREGLSRQSVPTWFIPKESQLWSCSHSYHIWGRVRQQVPEASWALLSRSRGKKPIRKPDGHSCNYWWGPRHLPKLTNLDFNFKSTNIKYLSHQKHLAPTNTELKQKKTELLKYSRLDHQWDLRSLGRQNKIIRGTIWEQEKTLGTTK